MAYTYRSGAVCVCILMNIIKVHVCVCVLWTGTENKCDRKQINHSNNQQSSTFKTNELILHSCMCS